MLDLLDWAERFVATPSVSRDGNEAIALLSCELLAEVGVEARLESTTHDGTPQHTLIADLGPGEGDDGLLLLTHLDTVPPGDAEAWTRTGGDPWCPTQEGDRLYGLGSADAKVDLVCKAAALEGIDFERLERPIRVVGTFAEEIGLIGARWLVEHGFTRGFQHALVGEPSELRAIHAHKGYGVYEARIPLEPLPGLRGTRESQTFEGAAAHSSTPHLGRNAIDAALLRLARADVGGLIRLAGGGAVNVVPDRCALEVALPGPGGEPLDALDPAPLLDFHTAWHGLLRELEATRDSDFDPPCTVGSLGRAELCDGVAVLAFDLRLVPGVPVEQPLERLGALAPRAGLRRVRLNPSLRTALDSPLAVAVAAAQQSQGLGRRFGTKATCTEAGLLAGSGLDVLVMGAGPSVGNVHRPNEHTRIPELYAARDLYREVITRLCVEGGAACSS